MSRRLLPAAFVTAVLWLAGTPALRAVIEITWTGNGATPSVLDGDNWDAPPTGDGSESFVFGDVTFTSVEVPAPGFAANNITFNTAANSYTFDGTGGSPVFLLNGYVSAGTGVNATFNSTLSLSLSEGTHTLTIDSCSTLAVHGTISTESEGAYLTKEGSGTLILSGSSTFGGVTVNAGTLLLGSSSFLNEGIIEYGPVGAGTTSGEGSLFLNNGTTLGLDSAVEGGNIDLHNNIALDANGETSVTIATNNGILSLHGTISGAAEVTKTGNYALDLHGSNTFTGDFYVNQGTVNVHSDSGTGLGALELGGEEAPSVNFYSAAPTIHGLEGDGIYDSVNLLGSPTQLTIDQSEDTVFLGIITGASGSVVKTGTGSLTLSGASTYAGGTTVSAGTLRLGDSTRSDGGISDDPNDFDTGPVGTGTLTLANGATLSTANLEEDYVLANHINLPGAGSKVTLALDNTDTLSLSGPISGPGAIDLTGSNFLSLAGNSPGWTGGLNIYGNNSVWVGHNNALPGPLWFHADSTSNVEFATMAPAIGGLSGGVLTGGNPGASVQIESSGAILTVNQAVNGVYDGIITGAGGLTKTGAGTLTMNTQYSDYTGATTINAGVLDIFWLSNGGEISSIGSSSSDAANLVINGGTLRYTNGGATTDRLFTLGTGGGTIDSSGVGNFIFGNTGSIAFSGTTSLRTLTLTGNNTTTTTLTPVIANPGSGSTSLVKSGIGTWTLAGANTYTGVTKILGGTLIVSSLANGGTASNIGAGDNTYDSLWLNGGTLQYTGPGASTDHNFAMGVNGATLDASGSGALVFTNTAAIANLFAASGARSLTLTGSNTDNNQLSGILGNSGTGTTSLIKGGAGKWVLAGANTYTGGTTIDSGTLNVSSTGALGTGGLHVGAGSLTLNNPAGQTVAYLSGGGTLALASGSTFTVNQSGNTTFSGPISGTGAHLTKSGSGTLKLSFSNSYSGGTTINGGTLAISNNSALGSTSAAVTVNSGGTLELNNNIFTSLSPVLNPGSTLAGNGTLSNAIIGTGVKLTPGTTSNPLGFFNFNDLTFGPNGIFEINVRYNGEGGFYFDQINVGNVTTLTITATPANPFTLKLVSLGFDDQPGLMTGTSLGNTENLTNLISTLGISGSLTLGSNLLVDSTNFITENPGATFGFTQNGNNFDLSFTPTSVPEPSTYALMITGLALVFVSRRRSRRVSP